MKRLLTVIAVLVVGATTFASSGKFGLDFSWGLNMGFQNIGITPDETEATLKRTDIALPVVRISSYNFFLLDNMLGAFASANLSFGLQFGDKIIANGQEDKGDTIDAFLGLEFMVGPSFGIDLSENLRFQTGLGFHYLYEKSLIEAVAKEVSKTADSSTDGEVSEEVPSLSLHAFGLALTPQLRFSPSRKASFILGCDIIFDFGRAKNDVLFLGKISEGNAEDSDIIPAESVDKYFRFGVSPYIGVGINF